MDDERPGLERRFDVCGNIETRAVPALPREHPEFGEPDALQVFSALGQPTRLAVFRHLVRHEPAGDCPGEMAAALDLSPATLSFHLKALQAAGLLDSEARGRHIVYRARLATVGSLLGYLIDNCCAARAASCLPFAPTPTRRAES